MRESRLDPLLNPTKRSTVSFSELLEYGIGSTDQLQNSCCAGFLRCSRPVSRHNNLCGLRLGHFFFGHIFVDWCPIWPFCSARVANRFIIFKRCITRPAESQDDPTISEGICVLSYF